MTPSSLLFIVAFVIAGASASAQTVKDSKAPLIDRFHIANVPFSKIVDVWSKRNARPYLSAMERYTSADQCQKRSGARFFSAFKSLQEIEICLFLIAETLSEEGRIIAWLESIGVTRVQAYDATKSTRLIGGALDASTATSIWILIPARIYDRPVSVSISINKPTKTVRSAKALVIWN